MGMQESLEQAAPAQGYQKRSLRLSLRSRLLIGFMRYVLRPWLGRLLRQPALSVVGAQLLTAGQALPRGLGLPVRYELVGPQRLGVGHVIGSLGDPQTPVLLWLHGGAFVLPASPAMHLGTVARLCKRLGMAGFMPDYRLAPLNPFPAALDDCEQAYRALLALGHVPQRILLGGDSAGGNLLFGLLQRIRAAGLPMPACAVALSPAGELSRAHAPPSRLRNRRVDALLSVKEMSAVRRSYVGAADASDPQISPIYADFSGFPPLYIVASEAEILLDDALLLAQRARAAGVATQLDVWPLLPHVFPLFAGALREARPAVDEIAAFLQRHLQATP